MQSVSLRIPVLSKYIGTSIAMQEIAVVVLREFSITLLLSLWLGYSCGLAVALFLKDCGHFPGRRHDRLVTVSILICHVYLPFLLAEAVELSGIVAIVACEYKLAAICIEESRWSDEASGAFLSSHNESHK